MNGPSAPRVIRVLIAEDDPGVAHDYVRAFSATRHGDQTLRHEIDTLETGLFGAPPPMNVPESVFETFVCQQGEHAVEVHREALAGNDPFDAALVDVRMPPGINGVETAQALRAGDPELLIGIVTGYSDLNFEEIADLIGPGGMHFFLRKPFERDEIRRAVLDGIIHSAATEFGGQDR